MVPRNSMPRIDTTGTRGRPTLLAAGCAAAHFYKKKSAFISQPSHETWPYRTLVAPRVG